MSIVEKVSKEYDDVVAGDNMTLNEHDIKFLKKLSTKQDEIKEIIISELLDINTKKIIKSIEDILRTNQIKTFFEMKCQENIVHTELKVQEEKIETILHLQEEKVRILLDLWEKQV
jgi:hypothetical protein